MDKLSVFAFLCLLYKISALKIIVQPENKVLIEGEPLTISCSFVDSSGYPTVTYERRYDGIDYEALRQDRRVYVTNSTKNTTEGYVTTAVLHFTSVKTEDDTDEYSWQCKASKGASETEQQGFTLYVIAKNDLPKAAISGGGAIKSGVTVTLTCNATDGKIHAAPLKGLWWVKDGKVLKNGTTNTIQPLILVNVTGKDGGEYRCVGVIKMKGLADYTKQMQLAKAMLNVKLKIDEGITKVMATESRNLTMECPADGYPLNVTWVRVNREGQEVGLDSKRYVVSQACSSCRSRLAISNLQPSDQGRYVCKATGLAGSTGKHNFDLSFTEGRPTAKPTDVHPKSSAVLNSPQIFWIPVAGLAAKFMT